jgi:hypothetical protein
VPVDAEGISLVTSYPRLTLLLLVLVYSLVFGPGTCLAGRGETGWSKAHLPNERLFKPHRVHVRHLDARKELGIKAVNYARRLLGVPYRYGGDSPTNGFDCSGFVRFVFGHFGLELPHSSYADFGLGTNVSRGSLRPGDLVFFDGIGHVGLYVGSGRFIHAPHTGTNVQINRLNDPWYQSRYDGARRVIRAASQHVRKGEHRAHRGSHRLQTRAPRRLTGPPLTF